MESKTTNEVQKEITIEKPKRKVVFDLICHPGCKSSDLLDAGHYIALYTIAYYDELDNLDYKHVKEKLCMAMEGAKKDGFDVLDIHGTATIFPVWFEMGRMLQRLSAGTQINMTQPAYGNHKAYRLLDIFQRYTVYIPRLNTFKWDVYVTTGNEHPTHYILHIFDKSREKLEESNFMSLTTEFQNKNESYTIGYIHIDAQLFPSSQKHQYLIVREYFRIMFNMIKCKNLYLAFDSDVILPLLAGAILNEQKFQSITLLYFEDKQYHIIKDSKF